MQPTSMRISPLGAFQDLRRRAQVAVAAAPPTRPVDTYVPAPRPVTPAALPKPIKPAGPLDGFGLKPGTTFQIAPGTTLKGHEVTGSARVVAVSGDHVELHLKGVAGGMMNFDVRFRATKQADGTVKLVADMNDPHGGPARNLLDQRAKVVKSAAGDLQLRAADGRPARLTTAGRGLRVQVADLDLKLVKTA